MRLDLAQRLALSLAGFAVGVALLLAGALWWAHVALERTLLDDVLARELEVVLRSELAPEGVAGIDAAFAFYRPARWPQHPAPPQLAGLAAGSHRDVAVGARHVHALVRELGPGDRAYLTYDVSGLEHGEEQAQVALAVLLLLTAALCLYGGGRIARRLLQPLHRVVARIRSLKPARPAQLAADPGDGEFSVLIEAVNGLLREIDQLVARERAFAAAASHELRTPLASARLAAEMLAAQPAPAAAPLARLQRALAAAGDTLNALLALSRERDLPEPQPLALEQFLPRVAEAYALQARDNGTTLAWELLPAVIEAAPGLVEVIFSNLLRNAIRATPGGTVTVGCDGSALWVRDTGEGIAAEALPTVFEPGIRGRHGGSGIGLYIARELAARCGWSLTLDSAPGRGTTARLRFAAP